MRRKPCAGNVFPGARLAAAATHRSSMHFDGMDAISGVKGPRSAPLNHGMEVRLAGTQNTLRSVPKKQKVFYIISRGKVGNYHF